jgi:hypothetical protein
MISLSEDIAIDHQEVHNLMTKIHNFKYLTRREIHIILQLEVNSSKYEQIAYIINNSGKE